MICAELSTVAWFVPNYRQLRDLCRTIKSYAICAEISTVAWIVQSYWQSRDLCWTFGLTNRHLTVFSLHNTTYIYLWMRCWCFLNYKPRCLHPTYRHVNECPCSNKSIITLVFTEREGLYFWANVMLDIDAWHSTTPCILLSNIIKWSGIAVWTQLMVLLAKSESG